MKFVDDVKNFWKWHSMRIMAVALFLPEVWELLPASFKADLPEGVVLRVTQAMILLAMIGRILKQAKAAGVLEDDRQ